MNDRTTDNGENLSREDRLAAKLRENLRRRKTQAREMTGSGDEASTKSALPKTGRES